MTARRRTHAKRASALLLLALLVAAAHGCGKKGNPLPPLRTIPQATTDLTLGQRGNQVVLHFSYPVNTTAGQKLTGISAVDIYEVPRTVLLSDLLPQPTPTPTPVPAASPAASPSA